MIAAVRTDRRSKAAEAAADAVVARIGKGEALQSIATAENLPVNQIPGMQRGMPAPTPEVNEAIFAAQRPAAGKVSAGKAKLPNGAYAVFAVEKVT